MRYKEKRPTDAGLRMSFYQAPSIKDKDIALPIEEFSVCFGAGRRSLISNTAQHTALQHRSNESCSNDSLRPQSSRNAERPNSDVTRAP